jgi:outer membrane receptor protein involved in Fe transport
MRILCLVVFVLGSLAASGQTVLRGRVLDGSTGEPVFSANVIVKGTTRGDTTDFDGLFRLEVASLPVTLSVSFVGYTPVELAVTSASQKLEIRLAADQILIDAAEVVGERISERQKQAPLTVESMDIIAIKEAPTGSFYEGLGALKGVDVTSASLGFKIINTRGFNSTSPVRSLQLIDGVDNQSPGLNFSLGNFLGAPDLDVKRVDIVAGASSAFYGPGAFNGVINMETKDPFAFPGLTVSTKIGERNLAEAAVRWADYFENKAGDPVFGYKFNFFTFSAYDWEATNYDPVYGSDYPATNPGRYDAVNIYGDEYQRVMDYSGDFSDNARGLGTLHRTGYREVDLVDYDTKNLKFSTAVHWRLQPERTYESPELVYGFSSGFGTTVYQGDNRFSLRDIEFYQHKVELRQPGKWFVRGYRTSEDAGRSYDPYATALRLQDRARPTNDWARVYYTYWVDSIIPSIDANWPDMVQVGVDPDFGFPIFDYPEGSVEAWYAANGDSLQQWHATVADWTNSGYAGMADIADTPLGFYVPGTPEFEAAFNDLTSRKNNEGEGGTRFFDQSSLIHVQGEYTFTPEGFEEWRVGGNFRRYTPNSDGTIFSDTAGRVITNSEMGFYTGLKKRFAEDRVIATATLRADKNQNFDWVFSPAASFVFSPRPQDFLRVSFSSALRNPTLADQYLFLDVGPATLVGNLNGRDSLVTIASFIDYRNSISASTGNISGDLSVLDYFNIAPIRPERSQSVEVGYRTTLWNQLYIDGSWYFSRYRDFIGYNIGLDIKFENPAFPNSITGVDAFRYAANSLTTVLTQGASIGLNWFVNDHLTLNGNYSFNELLVTDDEDPIIPAFNTPKHKYNVGFGLRDLELTQEARWGCNLNYKWIQGFVFEGSPQFTGFVPTYDLLDAQVNVAVPKWNTTFKVGGSNLLENIHIETYGGPFVGRLVYGSVLFELDHRKNS